MMEIVVLKEIAQERREKKILSKLVKLEEIYEVKVIL